VSILSNGLLVTLIGGGAVADVEFDTEFLVIAGGVNGSSSVPGPKYAGGAGQYISTVSGETTGGNGSAGSGRTLLASAASTPTYSVTVGATQSQSVFSGSEADGTSFTYTASTGSGKTSGDGFTGGSQYMPSNQCLKVNFYGDSFCVGAYTGGGGGASAAGSGQDGGSGIQSSITGTATFYAGGGQSPTYNGTNGTAGNGATNFGGGGSGAAGQPGAVILRYPNTVTISNPGGGLTMSTAVVGSNNVTTITAGTGNIKFTPA
jgi:hypothetical protein